ncbi:MAG TPA: Wzz/FepE/Etk N-terminal domain-containing protein [Verrucomicrobiae bacterium]|nr:Wzz/FepE/Etk N-terminal domain-containing protein [Verrucomicrobiae bacterium]
MNSSSNNHRHNDDPRGITPGEIYFVLFRHKWKIILLTLLGMCCAAAFWYFRPPPFQSQAKLFIRYVMDSRTLNPDAKDKNDMISATDIGANVMNTEMEILSSYDLALQVANDVGPEKILAPFGGGNNPSDAAAIIRKNLKMQSPRQSSVIEITFSHPDAALVQPVLRGIVSAYLDKHVQVHQAIGTSDDFLTEQTAQLRAQIAQTEQQLNAAKSAVGIVSVDDAHKSYTAQIDKLRGELFDAEAQLAEAQAVRDGAPATNNTSKGTITLGGSASIPANVLNEYRNVCARLDFLNKRENEYLTALGFTDQNKLVIETRQQMAETVQRKKAMESSYPALAGLAVPSDNNSGRQPSFENQMDAVLALQSRITVLKQQLQKLRDDAASVDAAESKIADLERKKQIQEGNYQYFATSLEQARIDEALGPGRVSNISQVQTPTPPFKDWAGEFKKMAIMVFGGLGLGLAWAFLIEFYWDSSVKRSVEVETKLKLPLFLAIPDMRRTEQRRIQQAAARRQLQVNGNGNGHHELEVIPWDTADFLNPYYDALRDRLVIHFESRGITHKPKFVAITGTRKGSGVSTVAAGLAASLSETGDGTVLLVDMNAGHGAAQQFFGGQSGCSLEDALGMETRDYALVQENLYVVTECPNGERSHRHLPKRFAALAPQLRSSNYDYIVFDLPPVSQTTITARMAAFMDITLLVIESERTSRETVQQATSLLGNSKATVAAVLNKTRKWVPASLQQEALV